LDRSQYPILRLEDLASQYIREIDGAGIEGPLLLLGYSFGGLVAFEIAQQLSRQARPVGFVGMLDTWLPSYLNDGKHQSSTFENVERKWRNIHRHLRNLIGGPERRRYFRETVTSKLRVVAYCRLLDRGKTIPSWFRDVNDLNIMAASKYRPSTCVTRLVLYVAAEEHRDERFGRDLGWGSVAGDNIELVTLPGNHRNLGQGNSEEVARIIFSALPD
jgi:thioesterase domain-containing protein